MSNSGFANTPLPYRWHGEGDPLVLIAGLGGKGTSWQPFLTDARRRFRVLTFDNPGSGENPPLSGPISIRAIAARVLELLDHLEVTRTCVIGRSMGGMIAQELALLDPKRVSKLVLVSTTGRADPHLAQVFELWARMAELGVPAEIRHRSSMLWCLGQEILRNGARVQAYLQAKATLDRAADYARQARACAHHDALDRLGGLQIPTLVVSGTDDRLTPAAHAEELAKTIPGSRLTYIPGAGHLAYLESPERFRQEVLGFLEEDHR